jgi:hypothetical protein
MYGAEQQRFKGWLVRDSAMIYAESNYYRR